MLQIDNHKELALSDIIPYLLQFNEIYKMGELSGNRYQVIEDIVWKLLYNLDYNQAKGVWLDYIGNKVGQARTWTAKPEGAFTFGGLRSEGFGAGKFLGSSGSGSSKNVRSDSSFVNAIKAKIIQNNTDTSLDDLINACKLLYNGKIVRIHESYPTSISQIDIYGSSLLKDQYATSTLKATLPAGVSLSQVIYHSFYNLFKNNAFITYDKVIPSGDDFELSFIVQPDELSETENTALLSQGINWNNPLAPIRCYYDVENNGGVTFRLSPSRYQDDNTGMTFYTDEELNSYNDMDFSVMLSGGTLIENDTNIVKITKIGHIYSLYINDLLVDTETNVAEIDFVENAKLFLGASNGLYYNSGSIYNLFLKNLTTNEIIINDPLRVNTIGTNNGVKFI